MPRRTPRDLPTIEVDPDDGEELARVAEDVAALLLRSGMRPPPAAPRPRKKAQKKARASRTKR